MRHATVQQILDVLDDVYSQSNAELGAQLSNVELVGDHRRFLVGRMGSTGSTWLAKLLNSHQDVFCTHEQILSSIYPKQSYGASDIVNLVHAIGWNTHHDAYRAVGDVGSVGLGFLMFLCGHGFTTALLLRHPARLMHTRLKVYPTDQSFTSIRPETQLAIQQIWGIDLATLGMLDRVLVNDLFIFVTQLRALGRIDVIVRIEDLLDPEYCQEVLYGLTGVHYEGDLIAKALANRVNKRTTDVATVAEIVNGFTPQHREWYRIMLGDAVPHFGYELDSEVTQHHSKARVDEP
jgi:hypothetical protein